VKTSAKIYKSIKPDWRWHEFFCGRGLSQDKGIGEQNCKVYTQYLFERIIFKQKGIRGGDMHKTSISTSKVLHKRISGEKGWF